MELISTEWMAGDFDDGGTSSGGQVHGAAIIGEDKLRAFQKSGSLSQGHRAGKIDCHGAEFFLKAGGAVTIFGPADDGQACTEFAVEKAAERDKAAQGPDALRMSSAGGKADQQVMRRNTESGQSFACHAPVFFAQP